MTFNLGPQVITELLGRGQFLFFFLNDGLLIPSFSKQVLIIHALFWPMPPVSATAD